MGAQNPVDPISYLTTFNTTEQSNSVTTSPAALTFPTPTISNPQVTLVTNIGTVSAYVSTISGGHTWIVPPGAMVPIPTGSLTLYAFTSSGTTTLYVIQGSY